MVGFNPTECEGKALPKLYYGVAGAVSGIITRALAQPIDVVKIRFQLQVEPMRKGSKYYGVAQAFHSILFEEGGKALWKGHASAQALSITYGMVQFTSFELLTRAVWLRIPMSLDTKLRPLTHFACGSISGCFATLAAHPFDVLRTRFVAQGEPKIYQSLRHATTTILKEEGFCAFYKGLLPTLVQIAPYTGFQFGFYSLYTAMWHIAVGKSTSSKIGSLQSLSCGGLAGVCSKVAIYPLDMVKKRLQIQGFEHGRLRFGATHRYHGVIHCIRTIVIHEGITGLYKGLSPSMIKALVAAASSFFVYEQVIGLLKYSYR